LTSTPTRPRRKSTQQRDICAHTSLTFHRSGQVLSIVARGDLSADVEDGAKVHLSVKYGLITIIRQTADLCDTVKKADLECPIKKGELALTKDIELPKQIPPGKYSVSADVLTKDDKKITCLSATVEFHRDGSVQIHSQKKNHEDI
jgi:hypothetical protein